MTEFIDVIFINPFLNLLMLLIKVSGGNLGIAVILLTLIFRIAFFPLNWKSLRSQRKMQQLKPQVDDLKAQHKDDRMAYSQAQMALYKEHGISPIGGCLPMLVQIPFLLALYAVLRKVVELKDVAELNSHLYFDWLHISQLSDINSYFLWMDLTKPDPWLILPLLAAASQFVLSRMMMPPKTPHRPNETKKEISLEDSMVQAQRQMVYFFPIMTFIFTWQFPSGLGLYWMVGNLFSIVQQAIVNRTLPHPALLDSVVDLVQSGDEEKSPEPKKKTKKTKSKKAKKK